MIHRSTSITAARARGRTLYWSIGLVALAIVVVLVTLAIHAAGPTTGNAAQVAAPTVTATHQPSGTATHPPSRTATAGGPPSVEDGYIAEGNEPSVFADLPAVSNLDRDLLMTVRRAATDARQFGIDFQVNSGWRSRDYQELLLRQAIDKYGSRAEASRWVATPEKSSHVTGEAVDLGPQAATDWLAQRSDQYGLCRVYANESWHFELRPQAVTEGCPTMYKDAAHDPRTHG